MGGKLRTGSLPQTRADFTDTRSIGSSLRRVGASQSGLCLNTSDQEDLRHAVLEGTVLPLCRHLPEQKTQNPKKTLRHRGSQFPASPVAGIAFFFSHVGG
jgi:hypothetical protein